MSEKGTVGLLKNPMSEKMAIETKRVNLANFAQMALFQQPHSPSPSHPTGTVPLFAFPPSRVPAFRPHALCGMLMPMEHYNRPARKPGVIGTLAMERTEISDSLVRRLEEGDREALAALMDLHGEGLMRYLVSITGSRDMAQDAFQDTWVRVAEKAHTFNASHDFAPWLFRIARNRALDLLRREKFRRVLGLDEAVPAAADPTVDFLERQNVRAAMARLPVRHREILGLRFYLDKSYEELAALLRLPLGTVKSRLNRALEKLAGALKKENVHDESKSL